MIRTIRKAEPVLSPPAPVTCAWRTGTHLCKLLPTSGRHCIWHSYWMRLVDAGNFERQQYEEFCEWWEQFQPYGTYGDNPGPWWAAIDVLWPALTGLGEAPVLTSGVQKELLLRRAEVRRYKHGLTWDRDPWPRMTGSPLPVWAAERWQKRIDDSKTQGAA